MRSVVAVAVVGAHGQVAAAVVTVARDANGTETPTRVQIVGYGAHGRDAGGDSCLVAAPLWRHCELDARRPAADARPAGLTGAGHRA
jgi:hypothetical protein